jgi:glycosyltransferase involved in cell wall biosynthesis
VVEDAGARIIVPVDLRPAFGGAKSLLPEPFGDEPSLLRATVVQLLRGGVAPVIVACATCPTNEPVSALLKGLDSHVEYGSPDANLFDLALRAAGEGTDPIVIVDPRAALVSSNALRAQLDLHRRSGAEMTLHPTASHGYGGITISRHALARLARMYDRMVQVEFSVEPLRFAQRARYAFEVADLPLSAAEVIGPASLTPRIAGDLARLSAVAHDAAAGRYASVSEAVWRGEWAHWTSTAEKRASTSPSARKPRVLFVHYTATRQVGASRLLESVLEEWDTSRSEPLLALPTEGALHERFRARMAVSVFDGGWLGQSEEEDDRWSAKVLEAADLLASARPSMVFLSNPAPAMTLACHTAGIPCALFMHLDFLSFEPGEAGYAFRRTQLAAHMRIITGSRSMAARIERLTSSPPGRVVVVHPGVRLDVFKPDAITRQRAREALQLPERAKVVTVAGTLVFQKRPELAIAALPALSSAVPEVMLCFAGAERETSGMQHRLSEKARALGVIDRTRFLGHREDMTTVYAATDVLLHAGLGESFGMVLAEAMAMGRPVVAFADGGPLDIVQDGVTGRLLAPTAGPREAADALAEILSDEKRCAEMGAAGLRRAAQLFDGRGFARGIQGLCEEIMHG